MTSCRFTKLTVKHLSRKGSINNSNLPRDVVSKRHPPQRVTEHSGGRDPSNYRDVDPEGGGVREG